MKNKKDIIKAIRSTWASLESHLPYCVDLTPKTRQMCGNEQFHIKTIRGYAETIKTLTDLL
jgi:hypothetical protein